MQTTKIILGSVLILFGILELSTATLDTWIAWGALAVGSVLLLSCLSSKGRSGKKEAGSSWYGDGGSGWSGSDGGDCGGGGE